MSVIAQAVAQALGRERLKEVVGFGVVGTVGFAVDAGVLAILFHLLDFGHYTARCVSLPVAISVTWLLNRSWTFSHRVTNNRRREYSIYFLVQSAGAGLNFLVYSLCIYLSPLMHDYPTLALAVGSVVAMVFNFFASRHLAFTSPLDTPPPSKRPPAA